MNNRERFLRVLNFESVDRLPVIEWASWWDKTIERWKKEGLPEGLANWEISDYFGLDKYRQVWIHPRREEYGEAFPHLKFGEGPVKTIEDYKQVKKYLYPEKAFDGELISRLAEEQKKGEVVVWITLDGFFWFPRKLFGIGRHLYAFYDCPEIMHTMNRDLLEYNLRVLNQFCEICTPALVVFAEDMSYNRGPMISKSLFDEFIAPYYRQIVPQLRKYEAIPFIDSDGNLDELIPWFIDVGVEGFLPLERQARCDVMKYRRKYSKIRLIGGYDKMVMSKGEEAMRAEFERILPVMKQGGYIPSVDHQTPPEVSLKNYQIYLGLLREYCEKAALN